MKATPITSGALTLIFGVSLILSLFARADERAQEADATTQKSASVCDQNDDGAKYGACMLGRLKDLSDEAILLTAKRDEYRRAAAATLVAINSTRGVPASLTQEAQFAAAWANDPDNVASSATPTQVALTQQYEQVCLVELSESARSGITTLRCAVARIRLSALDPQRHPPANTIKDIDVIVAVSRSIHERQPLDNIEPQRISEARRLAVIGLGFAAAARAETELGLATNLAGVAISLAGDRDSPLGTDYGSVGFAALICETVGVSVPIGDDMPPRVLGLLRLNHKVVAMAFPEEHEITVDAAEALAAADAGVVRSGTYNASSRSISEKEAANLGHKLYAFALREREPSVQDARLLKVQEIFAQLGQKDLVFEIVSRRYTLALQSTTDRPRALQAAASIASQLAEDQRYVKQVDAWALKLLPEIQALPDSSEGIAATLYHEVDSLRPALSSLPYCDRMARIAVLRTLNSRGKALAEKDAIHAGMLSPPFVSQAMLLDMDAKAMPGDGAEHGGTCSVTERANTTAMKVAGPEKVAVQDDELSREVRERLAASAKSGDPDQLERLNDLFARVEDRATEATESTSFFSPEHARLDRLAQRLFEAGKGVANRGRLSKSDEWTDFIESNAIRLYGNGDVNGASSLLVEQEKYLTKAPVTSPGTLANLLQSYPRVLRKEATPRQWDSIVYTNLIKAKARLGDTLGARGLLVYLNQENVGFSTGDILEAMSQREPTKEERAWLRTLPKERVDLWQAVRWEAELDATPVDAVEAWVASESPQESRRQIMAVAKLTEAKQFSRAEAIARESAEVRVRSQGAILLAEAGAVEWAEKLQARGISPFADATVDIAAARARPAEQASYLRRAAVQIPDIKTVKTRLEVASDLLRAAETQEARLFAKSVAQDYVNIISTESTLRYADEERSEIGYRLVRLGMYEDGMALFEQISDKRVELAALQKTALWYSRDKGDSARAKSILAKARATYESLTPFSQTMAAADLYETTARIVGLDHAYDLAKQLIHPAAPDHSSATYREHETFEGALSGLASAAVELEGPRVAADMLSNARPIGGDAATERAAMAALRRVASLRREGKHMDATPLITLIDEFEPGTTAGSDMASYSRILADAGYFDEAVSRIARLAKADERASAYADLAERAVQSSADRHKAVSLAELALRDARKIPWRARRVYELSRVASETAEIHGSTVAGRAIDELATEMSGPTPADRRIADAFVKLKSIVNVDATKSDARRFVSALQRFGEFFEEQGYTSKTAEVISLLKPFEANDSVAKRAQKAIVRLGPGTSTEKYVAPMVADWKQRATHEPGLVLAEIEDDNGDYRDESLPLGIEAFRLGLALSLDQLSKTDKQATLSVLAAPNGAPVASQVIADKLLALLSRQQKASGGPQDEIARQAFEVMAVAQRSAAATALLRAMSRQAMGKEGGAAQLADVAAQNWQRSREQLITSITSTQDVTQISTPLNDTAESRVQFDMKEKVALDRTKIYLSAIRDSTAKLAQVSKILRPDEAVLLYRFSRNSIFLSVVTRDKSQFFDLASSRVDPPRVQQWVKSILQEISGSNEDPGAPYESAFHLYKAMLEPAEPLLAGVRHLIVIPDGPLAALPFQVMLTTPFRGSRTITVDLQSADWLVKKYSLTVAPSVVSMLLAAPVTTPPAKGLIGFGDPAIGDWEPHGCSGSRALGPGGSAARQALGANEQASGATAGEASRLSFKGQAIPDTGCLLAEMARTLSADPGDIFLGLEATETRLKQLSEGGTLADHRIIAFATHGEMAGEEGFSEAGLVLSPPRQESKFDDGYLSASEIATLSLNADLIVLSACNTAAGAGNKGDGEAFGGLASAFLFAGARHLYVSHWEVDASAASAMFDAIFKNMKSASSTGRDYADALQRTELEILRHAPSPTEANPSFWAPFSAVGS
ncbi:CHAT domain-containing protein [Caballeronia sp. INML2]|uniref:CHAT domain-containing protein n=1 Tax=Caballeronia sp. INML2 TaxID=2921748 RepID=UPI002028EAC5|nr:CHAT domain-containing protein [Caballeronia sp. INML2]